MSERRSVWEATAADAPFYEPLQQDSSSEVVVVGAGITGLTTALLLQRRGAEVVLVEAVRVGSGTTGRTTGKVTTQHGLKYAGLVERHGGAAARAYADANRAGVERIAAFADELGGRDWFARAPAVVYARSDEEAEALAREDDAARALGLPSRIVDDADLPFPTVSALEFAHQAHIHPVRYCHALARELVGGGGRLFENTRVTGVDENAGGVKVEAGRHRLNADQVVVATLLPIVDRAGLFAKARPSRSYGVAAILDHPPPRGMFISVSEPVRSLAPWAGGPPNGAIIAGETHPTGSDQATPGRWGELERWANEHFDVRSFEYRWSSQDYATADGMPYVGRSPLLDRVYVAAGFDKWGLSNGSAAAEMLAGMISERGEAAPSVFSAGRIGDAAAVVDLIAHNSKVAAEFLTGQLERLVPGAVEELERGDGGLVEVDGRTVAAYRDPSGEVHALAPSCTHLGCNVEWNDAENSWDCPCHGSRFDIDGAVLTGPATQPLERVHVELEPDAL